MASAHPLHPATVLDLRTVRTDPKGTVSRTARPVACPSAGSEADVRPGQQSHWLTDEQWAVLEPLLPKGARVGRPPVRPRRRLIDGIRFRIRTGGVPWRDIPVEYGP
ncbi:transposase [Streptomyces sp. NPDC056004]|uniref:transposase n=1 Tax=unclassified Streptomyces TaxID=2593676 RepID=UPI0035DBF76B